ncbi:MAG: helix-turn-helix transcriptional regulator [Mesorhizobium sp.]
MTTIFKTPNGDEMVILPRAEYDRLVEEREMAHDVAVFDRFKQQLARGEEELIPSDVVERLLAGENPVKVWRSHRGLSARELAKRTNLSASYLSEIEHGRKDGSISAMKNIADVLGLSLDEVV